MPDDYDGPAKTVEPTIVMVEEYEEPSEVLFETILSTFGYVTQDGLFTYHNQHTKDIHVGGHVDKNNVFHTVGGEYVMDLDSLLTGTPRQQEEALQHMHTYAICLPNTPKYLDLIGRA